MELDNIIKEADEESVIITAIYYKLSPANQLQNGKYRIPQSELIHPKHWGIDIDGSQFSADGKDIRLIK